MIQSLNIVKSSANLGRETLLSNKKALIIGQTNLCIECVKCLIKNHWDILHVISDDINVIQWCNNNSISCLKISKLNEIRERQFYLFSIINPYLIPKSFVNDKDIILSLNYHDSLLPKYAGVNSTTWAIIHRETIHGVTLHKITEGIDEGDIVGQSKIKIEDDETALSLNLKCSENLLILFQDVIQQIESNSLSFRKQNLKQRSYYGLKEIPANYGIINGIKSPQELSKLVRGLTFGSQYNNPVSTIKLFLDEQFFILDNAKITTNKKESESNIDFKMVRDIYGNDINLKFDYKYLGVPYILDGQTLDYLSHIKVQENRYKKQILDFIESSDASLSTLNYEVDRLEDNYYEEISYNKSNTEVEIVSIIYIALARFFWDKFIVSLYFTNNALNKSLQNLVDYRNFICIDKTILDKKFINLQDYINEHYKTAFVITKDFGYRYHLQLLTDIAIVCGEVSSVDKHQITMTITNNKLKLKGKWSHKLCINSLSECIKILIFKHETNNLITADLSNLSILSEVQYNDIMYKLNATEKDYPKNKTIHEMFEEQVKQTPNNLALVYEDIKLTYKELNEKSNQLAHYLTNNHNLRADDFILILLDRGPLIIISILAVLKSGCAYVPVDSNYPDEQVKYIIKDTHSKLILTNQKYHGRLFRIVNTIVNGEVIYDEKIIILDNEPFITRFNTQSVENLLKKANSSDLAYLIYTSGTTGKPKGVMIEHGGLVNFVIHHSTMIKPTDIFLGYINYTFDAINTEVYLSLIFGGTLYLLNNEVKLNLDSMYHYIVKNNISIIVLPSVIATEFLEHYKIDHTNIRLVIVGGDVYDGQLNLKNTTIINAYGLTETTTCSFMHEYSDADIKTNIGRPISNTKCYILDHHLSPLPLGAIGELYIGGAGVARGYLNLPELTAERFIVNPFQSAKEKYNNTNSRLYKTGDLVRYLQDGNIEYIGRNDFQVKIRGYRIELGEIGSKLSSYPEVKQSVVVAQEHNGNKYLVGYYVSDKKLDEELIFTHLNNNLPEYMVPNIVVWLDKLPLTINGKLDHKALPNPEFTSVDNYIAPQNEIEQIVCEIYAEVLGLEASRVGIRDNFFKLGGDSIVSIQLVIRLKQSLNLHISIKDIFANKTIEKLYDRVISEQLSAKSKDRHIVLSESGILSGTVELLPIQEWFFGNFDKDLYKKPGHWNQSFLIKTSKLDREILKHSLVKLIEHHDAFRLNYLKSKKVYKQSYSGTISYANLDLLYLDISKLDKDTYQDCLTGWQSNFELFGKNSLYSIGYIDGYKDGSSRIFFAIHHLLIDMLSWCIITRDLKELYTKLEVAKSENNLDKLLKQSSEQILNAKGTSYRQWVYRLKAYAINNAKEVYYWHNEISELKLFQNNLSLLIVSEDTLNYADFSLDKNYTELLLTSSNNAYHTEINDLLLASFGIALSKLTNSKTNYVTLEGDGREEIAHDIDINQTVGWFTTMYPVKLNIEPDNLIANIIQIKETLRNIPNKGIYYGMLCGYLNPELPKVSFNYLGQFGQKSNEGIDLNNWNIVAEASGISMSDKNHDNNIINANGLISDGKLSFGISSKLSKSNLNKLIQKFKETLTSLTEYTSNLNRGYLSISDVDKIINQDYLDKLQSNKEISHVYLANSLQQGFIYHVLNQGDKDTAYRVQILFNYNNKLNPDLLKEAWSGALVKYPVLRLRFAWDDELVQIIDKNQDLIWEYIDLSSQTKARQNKFLDNLVKSDRNNSYDLSRGNLLRIFLVQLSEANYHCMISNHHAISDGWSNPILLSFVHELYLKLLETNGNSKLQEQILSDIKEESSYLLSQKYLQNVQPEVKKYWWRELARINNLPDLSGLLREESKGVNLSEYRLILNRVESKISIKDLLYKQIKQFSYNHEVTINVLLQYVWHKLLSVYGNSQTTVVGTTISGRNLPIDGIDKSVGLYINTLPLIFDHGNEAIDEKGVKRKLTLLDKLHELQNTLNNMNMHSNVSLSKLHKSGRSLFDSLFVYENYPVPKVDKDSIIQISNMRSIEELDYPMSVLAYEHNDTINVNIKYARELFSELTINQLFNHFNQILDQITSNKIKYQDEINYLDKSSYNQMVTKWNQTEKSYPEHKTIYQMFEEQVKKTPTNIAIIYGDIRLSYKELNERANQLANYLRSTYKIKVDDLIGLCLDRSEHMLIAIFGVLKSGGAYVPMDPSYPDDRIGYILGDTRSKVVLTNEKYESRLNTIIKTEECRTGLELIDSNKFIAIVSEQSINNLKLIIKASNLAYVIYTSGTTGNPKGVMIEHSNAVNYLFSVSAEFKSKKSLNIDFSSNLAFDLSVTTTLYPLVNGHKVCVYGGTLSEVSDYINHLNTHKVNLIKSTPTFISTLANGGLSNKIDYCISGGEKLEQSVANQILSFVDIIIDEYGPTETTVGASRLQISKVDEILSIGRAYPNYKLYILDSNLSPLPLGAIGELYIGGIGVARGYLNLPELTAEKFIINPFQNDKDKASNTNSRLYKTGDLARYLPDGNIEYIGRNDFQVKIRGYRIELGEIGSKLSSYPEIRQSVVLAQEHNGNKYLVGYYVSDKKLDKELIFTHLNNSLPEYMVPNIFVWLDKLPLTINGKLDHKALPNPEFTSVNNYIAPQNEIEQIVCEIYAEVLGLEASRVGIRDNFFKLGGNSILAIKLLSKLNRKFNHELKVIDLFVNSTVESMAKLVPNIKSYNYIIKLNKTVSKSKIFMIHPAGGGGCEVYTNLAESLNEFYECYGVDNYNLYNNDNKYSSLNSLASYYLKTLQEKFDFQDNNVQILILGWSLGGVIAIEMAGILESKGYRNIKIYALDSIIRRDEEDSSIKHEIINHELNKKQMYEKYLRKYGSDYAQKVLGNYETDSKIIADKISYKLLYTQIVLFKAIQKNEDSQFNSDNQCQKLLKKGLYNNLDIVVQDINQITLITVPNTTHTNIIEAKELIKQGIIDNENYN